MCDKKVLAGIVSYQPDIDRLRRNIQSVRAQSDSVVVFDNASANIEDIEKLCAQMDVHLIKSDINKGLAGALNILFMRYAKKFEWILTLDQDSVCPANYVDRAARYFSGKKIGIITSSYYEKNIGMRIEKTDQKRSYLYRNRCITSGAFVKTEAYLKTSGYDEYFSVDYVDFDFSIRLRLAGYRILCMNDVVLEHELGQSEMKRFLFWKFRYTKHSAQREYLIARNIVIFIRRYHKVERTFRDFLSLGKHFVLSFFYDKERKVKLKALITGVIDGFRYRK